MTVKILHTADLHLGMKFVRGYEPEIQERLVEARFETLGSLIELANTASSDLLVIAGRTALLNYADFIIMDSLHHHQMGIQRI